MSLTEKDLDLFKERAWERESKPDTITEFLYKLWQRTKAPTKGKRR